MVPTLGTNLSFLFFVVPILGTTLSLSPFLWYPFWVPRCHCLRFCGTHFGYHLSIFFIYGTLFGYHFCPFLCCSWYPKWVPSWFFLPLWYPFWVPQNHVFQWQDTHFVVQMYKMHLLGSSLIPLLTFHASMII